MRMRAMEVTDIRISLFDDAKLKAFVTIVLNDVFMIRGLKIIVGHRGTFVAMPSRKLPDGTFQDLAHPINNEARAWLEHVVLEAYHREIERQARPPEWTGVRSPLPSDPPPRSRGYERPFPPDEARWSAKGPGTS